MQNPLSIPLIIKQNLTSQSIRYWVLPVILFVECLVLGSMSPYFWDTQNLLDRTRHIVEIGLMATTMTFIITTGGIDLAVGSILGLASVVFGVAWFSLGESIWLAGFITLLAGSMAGALQGWIIAYWRIPPLLVTLAGLALFRGMAFGITKDQYVSNFPEAFRSIGQGYIWMVPYQLIPFILVFLLMGFLFNRTLLGRQTALIGENEIAAHYAGIPVQKVKWMLYTLSGLMSGLAALIYTARMNTSKPSAGEDYELDVITCVVLGGTRITGGSGSIVGTLLGLLILTTLRYGLELAGVSSEWITLLVGLLLISTAVVNERFSR